MFSHLKPEDRTDAPIPNGRSMGHVHLHEADADKAVQFYNEVLGYRRLMLRKAMKIGDLTLDDYLPHRIMVNLVQLKVGDGRVSK